ncbi:MAG TPA: helix-turn-helix domain-containing protein [Frankiaceae bacterium]|nr:helix-turn-helix domain-containing protein [Frankiaceae bacterium]
MTYNTLPGAKPTPGRPCSVASALAVLGEKWALLAIRELFLGNRRFDRIAANTGAPRDILTARLRSLERAGIVERRAYQERPQRFEYRLTEAGRDLQPILHALRGWGDKWAVDETPLLVRHHDHQLVAGTYCRTCGEPVETRDLSVESRAPGWSREGRLPKAS